MVVLMMVQKLSQLARDVMLASDEKHYLNAQLKDQEKMKITQLSH